jgi:tRNA-2-methylthio-N6-dimethylallyladenosine synthase
VVEVLVEGPSRRELTHQGANAPRSPVKQLTGRSMADHIVVFDGTERLIGHTVRVAVEDASPFTLYGTVLTDEVVGVDVAREPQASTPARPDRFSLPLV